MDSPDAFKVLEKQFQLNKKQYYNLRQKLHSEIPVVETFKELEKKGYLIGYGEWKEDYPLPDVLLVMSPQMQANYHTFGDAVSFDITYKCCSYFILNQEGKEKYWNLGVFSVFIEDCRPIICGMVLILEETIVNFIFLFKLLF